VERMRVLGGVEHAFCKRSVNFFDLVTPSYFTIKWAKYVKVTNPFRAKVADNMGLLQDIIGYEKKGDPKEHIG